MLEGGPVGSVQAKAPWRGKGKQASESEKEERIDNVMICSRRKKGGGEGELARGQEEGQCVSVEARAFVCGDRSVCHTADLEQSIVSLTPL